MTRARTIYALHTARVRLWAVATIPTPDPAYALETTIRLGERGAQYIVVSAEDGSDMRVYPARLPRRRSMRRCGLRSEIQATVARALPSLRPVTAGAT